VSIRGSSLNSMFLAISDVHDSDDDLCVQKDLFVTCRTSKGSMTSESMAIYLNEITKSYCKRLRRERKDDRLPVCFAMNICAAYNRPKHLRLMASLFVRRV
jgi:hypothetical protein